MHPLGFSSGALAKGDFERGIALQRGRDTITAVELSALRDSELRPLLDSIGSLDLSGFAYVSFHAPSRLGTLSELELIEGLRQLPSTWPIVVHPDVVETVDEWRRFGRQLCIENMDNRKTTGRTVAELAMIFDALPEAGFCFDIGHARQIDPTMAVATRMLKTFGSRLRQVHVSEVGPYGEHLPLSILAREAFRAVVRFVPADCPLILESVIPPAAIDDELRKVREVFAV